jgi:hypothetical protein
MRQIFNICANWEAERESRESPPGIENVIKFLFLLLPSR